MSYLHCHNCDFSQDDFWSKSYNPIRYLLQWEDYLLGDRLDEQFTDDALFLKERGPLTTREVVAQLLEKTAQTIRGMDYRTLEEFNAKNPERLCPVCGKDELDID